ncbi:MAG: class I SAM-dependent methyltransferase [Alphaproteobacteria bacterium]|nr:class I SAM-dependent methyltransferase [Alphaproteobacteria bacterium]
MTEVPDVGSGSPERFGYSWGIFSEILPVHEVQFRRWTSALPREAWEGVTFLDVGCGMGRNSHWALAAGAQSGRAIDVDEQSLSGARQNLAGRPVRVDHESVYDIAEPDTYDIAFSIGVIHHLGDPQMAVQSMARATRPGGKVLIWVYGYENNEWIVKWFNPLRRALFSRLPLPLVFFLSLFPTGLLWALLHLGWGRLEYHDLLRRLSFRHLRAIVFDQMIPQIAHYYRRDEVESLMRGAGLEDVRLEWVNEMSWSAVGTKPGA